MTIEPYNYNDEPSGRSETLVQALERCERLEKQLDRKNHFIEMANESMLVLFKKLDYEMQKKLKGIIEILKQAKELEK